MEYLNSTLLKGYLSSANQQLLRNIYTFDTLESTNSWLLEHKHCNSACLAETQTKGKGRRGNKWQSDNSGNIYLSLSWCFDSVPSQLPLLSLMVGISLCDTLQYFGMKGHGLKWPNDIYVDNKKLAGILVETADNLHRVVIGVGLNVKAQTAVSWCGIEDHLPEAPDINELAGRLLDGLTSSISTIHSLSFDDVNQQWKQWDIVLDKPIYVLLNHQKSKGVAKGVDEHGQIVIEMEEGGIQHFHSAEISLRW